MTEAQLKAERVKAVSARSRDLYITGGPYSSARERKSRDNFLMEMDGYIAYIDAELAKL